MLDVNGLMGEKIDFGKVVAPPATIRTTIVSPRTLASPRIMEVQIPEIAAGRVIFVIVSHLVAPRAYDASFKDDGTDEIASSEMLAMVGIDINESIIAALNRFNPLSILKMFCKNGAKTTIPKKPMTTDGIDAISSMVGLNICLMPFDAISERYMAIARLKGTAMIADKNVTESEAAIKGKMPNFGGVEVGYHCLPSIKSFILTTLNTGNPSLNKKIIIRNSIDTEKKVTKVRSNLTSLSLILWEYVLYFFFIFFIQKKSYFKLKISM